MAAEIGNQYAQKYSEDSIAELLAPVLTRSMESDCYFILDAIKGHITKDQWDYFTDNYSDNSNVFRITKTIKANTEQNLVAAMLAGKVKETASIFLLKCKYGYVDKQQVDHNVNGSININLQFPDQE